MKFRIALIFLLILITSFSITFAQTGPAGIGSATGSGSLKFWIRPDNGISTTGSLVDSWTNSVGISALDISETGSQRPTLVSAALNGYDEISFNGSNRLRTGLTLTTSNFVNNEASSFVICRADNTSQSTCVYTTDPLVSSTRFSCHIPWSNTVYYDIGNCCGTDARMQVGGLTGLTSYSIWSYDASSTNGKQLYRNGTLLQDRTNTNTYNSHASQRFNIGGNTSGTGGYFGDITEIIIYNSPINTAQRIIVQNYLSAKYDIGLSADDLYTMDDAANGDYDHDVAGIGRENSTNLHTVSQGTGIVQISKNGAGLGDGEYLFWGHDNGFLGSFGNNDVPVGVDARLGRIWRISEVGEPGIVDIAFDLTGLGPVTASDLRLLIDVDADGDFSNANVITGATNIGGNYYEFSTGTNNAIEDGYTFTIATINTTTTPLPITLLSFDAKADFGAVNLNWLTASEINNDFFTIEKSRNGEDWEILTTIKGAGTSTKESEYSYRDEHPFIGTSYYQLKQTDFDGKFSYSKPVVVDLADGPTINLQRIFPNPSDGDFTLEIESNQISQLNIEFISLEGVEIFKGRTSLIQGNNKIKLRYPKHHSGTFLIKISNDDVVLIEKISLY